jgi:tetratricopeptide (TPR) repeat protein
METRQNMTTKILKYTLWGCLYLTLFTVLLVNSNFLFPFITLKTLYFRILVEIAVLLYLLLALSNSRYRPRMNKILWFILGFGGVVLLTAIFGVDPYRSFWGTIERGEGFLFISHLIAYTFILSQVFKTRRDWYNFFTLSVFVSLLVGLYAMAQELGVSWSWILGTSTGNRLASTLGNPSYLGAYALGHFWLCLLLFWQKRHLIWKIIFVLIGLFEIFILFQTQTRGAMLAFLITLFLLAVAFVIFSPSKKIKLIFSLVILLLVFISSFIWFNRDESWIKGFPPLSRLVSLSSGDVTIESRLLTLDSSWRGWQDRFLIGYGWENYNIAFNKYFHAEIYRDSGSQIWFDRAHNTVMDVAVATGLFGLLAYLAIYLYSFMTLFKLARQGTNQLRFPLTLMAFLTAHFIQNLVVFDSLPTYIMLFSVFAFVAFLASEEVSQKSKNLVVVKSLNLYALFSGILILSFLIFNLNIKPAQANIKGIHALMEIYRGNFQEGLAFFKDAIGMKTYQTPEIRQKLAEALLQGNTSQYVPDPQTIKENYEYGLEQIKLNIYASPDNARNYLYLLTLLNSAASSTSNADYLKQVLSYGQEALELSPTRPQIYFEMGRAALGLGQPDQAIEYFQKAVALNPKTMDSHWNLLTVYILSGHQNYAQQEYQTMLKLGLREDTSSLERLAQIQSSVKNYSVLIPIYQKLIKINPDNFNYWDKLALTYRQLGDYANARSVAGQAISKFPANRAQMEEFLKTLD